MRHVFPTCDEELLHPFVSNITFLDMYLTEIQFFEKCMFNIRKKPRLSMFVYVIFIQPCNQFALDYCCKIASFYDFEGKIVRIRLYFRRNYVFITFLAINLNEF